MISDYHDEERIGMDFIRSKDVRDYLKQQHYLFSDAEKATLIFHSGYPIERTLDKLKTLMEHTADTALAKEIQERIEYENVIYETLVSGDDSVIFQLEVKDDGEFEHLGLFKTFEGALSVANSFHKEFLIRKKIVLTETNTNTIKDLSFHDEIGRAQYTENGERMYQWCKEVEDEVIGDSCKGRRFEDAYVSFPYPFKIRDTVKNVRTGRVGTISVLAPERKEFMDYLDFSLTVEYKAGGHEHVFPGDVEYDR